MGGIGAAVRSIRPVDLPGKVLVVGDLAVCQLPLAQKPFPQKISHKLPVKVHPHRWVDRPVFPVLIPGDRFALCFSVPGAPLQLEQVDIAWKILLQPEQTIDEGIQRIRDRVIKILGVHIQGPSDSIQQFRLWNTVICFILGNAIICPTGTPYGA